VVPGRLRTDNFPSWEVQGVADEHDEDRRQDRLLKCPPVHWPGKYPASRSCKRRTCLGEDGKDSQSQEMWIWPLEAEGSRVNGQHAGRRRKPSISANEPQNAPRNADSVRNLASPSGLRQFGQNCLSRSNRIERAVATASV
jgi:hypothetical protein